MQKQLSTDTKLSVRMFITMFLLAALYLGFALVLVEAGTGAASVVTIISVMLAVQYFFSDKMVLWSTGARLVSPNEAPELHSMVERLSALADLPKPGVAIMNSSIPNAFATGRNQKNAVVAVTSGILKELNAAELEAVIAHELTHIKNRDVMVITLASFFATVASFIVQRAFLWGYQFRSRDRDDNNGFMLVYLASLLVWVISYFLIRALSRYREYAADRGAAVMTGAPSQLSAALLKISGTMQRIPQKDLRQADGMNAFYIIPAIGGESLVELFSTHPSLENRIAYLGKLEAEMEGR